MDTKMNMVEKVAKRLYPMFDVECVCNRCADARADARAAIEAMETPTPEMICAAESQFELFADEYSRAIRAALKE